MRFRKLKNNNYGSAIAFIVSMLIVGMVVSALIGSFAYSLNSAAEDTALAGGDANESASYESGMANATLPGVPGGPAMILLMGLLFIVIPVIIFAKAAT